VVKFFVSAHWEGGPGSELLGVVKFIERLCQNGGSIELDFALVDSIPEWSETWKSLLKGLEDTFRVEYGNDRQNWPIRVHRSFLPLDLTKVKDFRQYATMFNDIDIFIFNYTVSEVAAYKDAFQEVFNYLVDKSSHDAYFLFIDRNQRSIRNLVEELIKHRDLIDFGIKIENHHIEEPLSNLGIWQTRIGVRPKRDWRAFYGLAQKDPIF
jgi:hypothetical protein